jgi:hypothetical protein
MKYHGVDHNKFVHYLKEFESRNNHFQHDYYDDPAKCISEYFRVASIQ